LAKSELHLVLSSERVDGELPTELPLAHLTVARWLRDILAGNTASPLSP